MPTRFEDLERQARELSTEERARLAEAMLESLRSLRSRPHGLRKSRNGSRRSIVARCRPTMLKACSRPRGVVAGIPECSTKADS